MTKKNRDRFITGLYAEQDKATEGSPLGASPAPAAGEEKAKGK